jgi:hypothetical protein
VEELASHAPAENHLDVGDDLPNLADRVVLFLEDVPETVRGGLTVIATAIQTMGAAAPAYALVKGALALLGVHLP